jgi:tRNA A37 threonylcarbamoyladenosine biosynthesis protein TsaE
VLVVEWPERAAGMLPEEHLLVRFHVLTEEARSLEFEAIGARAEAIVAGLRVA